MALKVLKGRTSTDIYPAQEWLTQSVLEEERHQLLSLPPQKQSLSKGREVYLFKRVLEARVSFLVLWGKKIPFAPRSQTCLNSFSTNWHQTPWQPASAALHLKFQPVPPPTLACPQGACCSSFSTFSGQVPLIKWFPCGSQAPFPKMGATPSFMHHYNKQ